MIGAERWKSNWLGVSPPGSVRVDLPLSSRRKGDLQGHVRSLPAGTPVVLFASTPGAGRRCRAFASRAGVRLEREYLAFPSATAPACLVEDAPGPVRTFVGSVLVAPPRAVLGAAIDAGVWVVRAVHPWRLIRTLAPGRVVIGVCT